MKKVNHLFTLLFFVVLLSTANVFAQGLPNKTFGAINQENIKWLPFPAFPPQARLAVLVGVGGAEEHAWLQSIALVLGAHIEACSADRIVALDDTDMPCRRPRRRPKHNNASNGRSGCRRVS